LQKSLARKKSVSTAKPQNYPDKLFYKIGEVSRIAEVEPYVLRYWETEFTFLKPRKSKSGQRIYVKKDLELIFQIKEMLYKDRFTIEGVRKKFSEGISSVRNASPAAPAVEQTAIATAPLKVENLAQSKTLEHVKSRLRAILKQLD
jgi:DNA-binding transcriptional MerR regulator